MVKLIGRLLVSSVLLAITGALLAVACGVAATPAPSQTPAPVSATSAVAEAATPTTETLTPESTSVPTGEATAEAPTTPPVLAPLASDFSRYIPFTAELTLSHAPTLEEAATLTFTFAMKPDWPKDIDQVDAWINLPTGAVWLGGDLLKWRGDLKRGQPVTLRSTVAFVEPGNWTIQGSVRIFSVGDGGQASVYVPPQKEQAGFLGTPTLVWPRGRATTAPAIILTTPTGDPAELEVSTTAGFKFWVDFFKVADYGWQAPPAPGEAPIFLVISDWTDWEAAKTAGYIPRSPIGKLQRIDELQRGQRSAHSLNFDFESYFLVVVLDRARETTGYRVVVREVRGRAGVMRVIVEASAPAQGMAVEPIPNRAYSIIAVSKRFALDGEPTDVVFLVNGEEVNRDSLVLRTGEWVSALKRDRSR